MSITGQETSTAETGLTDEDLEALIREYGASSRVPSDADVVCALRELLRRRAAERVR